MPEYQMSDYQEQPEEEPSDAEPEPESVPAESSGSEVVDASAIFVVHIEQSAFRPWTTVPGDPVKVRQGRLRLAVTEVLKGRLDQPAGELFEMDIAQRGGVRVVDYYGLWSEVPVGPGTDLVAFAHGGFTDARVLLQEANCHLLIEAEKVLQDARAAVMIESRKMAPDAVLKAAATALDRLGDLFARFVWTQVKDAVLRSPELFDAYLRLIEDPKTTVSARDAYLSMLNDDLGNQPSKANELRLAQAMCRLLLLEPVDVSLKEAIAGVYLPNLLKLDTKKAKYTPAEVLGGQLDRGSLSNTVKSLAAEEERANKLSAWLAQ